MKFLRFCSPLLISTLLFAQADRGSISGTITDATGAAIPSIALTLQNQANNLTYSTTTSSAGAYSFLNLPVGVYNLSAVAKGFQRTEAKGIPVEVNQQARIDMVLQLGEVTQTVEVAGGAAMIQTESTDVGTVMEGGRFLDLPLTLGGGIRAASAFIFLAPGVSGTTWEKHVGGSGSFTDQVYFDGIALVRGDLANDVEVAPSVDAIAEYKLITNNYSAEYAHALGGVTSFTMKSGTNQIHGTAFEFADNDHTDARGFFAPTKAYRNQNEFGFTLGAPIWIPKVYNGHNKTFFFVSFDQFYLRGGQLTGLNTNPTAPMLQGNFSQWPGAIYDPRSTQIAADGTASRTPFPGNIIPQSAFSSVTSKMLQYIPPANLPGLSNNAIAPLSSPWGNARTHGYRADHAFSEKHHISGMYNSTDRPYEKSPGPSRLLPVGNTNYNIQDVTTEVIRFNYDWTISPALLNHFGFGYSRFRNPNFSTSYNQGWEQPNGGKLGLTGTQYDLFPTIEFNTQGYTRFGDDTASDNYFNTTSVLDNLTWIKSKHTIKIGGETQIHEDNYRNYNSGGGDFFFSSLETGLPGVANSGNSFASYLLGAVDNGSSYFRASLPGGRYKYYGAYIDDTFKVSTKLTLDVGLRYEIQVPASDVLGRISYMNPSLPNPGAGNLPGVEVFGNNGTGRNQFTNTQYKNFGPRVGFAYTITPKTVIRGGYGIFYAAYISEGVNLPQNGFSITPSFTSPNNGLTPAFYWDSGFPQNFSHPPNLTPTVQNGQGAQLVNPDKAGIIPYSQQYNLTVERQVNDSLMVSAAYVGNKGTHIYDASGAAQANQVNPAYFSLGTAVLQSNINSPLAQAAGISAPFAGFSQLFGAQATVAQALRPLPQYQGVTVIAAPYTNSTYNALQIKADKRFSHGLSGTFAYTHSKMLSDGVEFTTSNYASGVGYRQNFDHREKFLYPTDQPNLTAFSLNYALPFGQNTQAGLKGKALGGWSVAAFGTYGSGFPLPIQTVNTNSIVFTGGLRPNLTGQPIRAAVGPGGFDPNRDYYLNPAAFAQPAPLTFGSAPAYLGVRQPFLINESFGVFKNTRFFERVTNQFRLEMTNPLNRVVFGAPIIDFSNASFGKVGSQYNSPRLIQFGMKMIW